MPDTVISTPSKQFQDTSEYPPDLYPYRIKNWSKFQHYKKRNPPWVKVHASIFTSDDWVGVPDNSKLLMIVCIIVASRFSGFLPRSAEYVQRRAGLRRKPDFKPLISCGFLVKTLANASTVLAYARPETENREEETETEKKRSKIESASPSAQPPVFHVEQTVKERGKSMKGARLSEGWLPSSEDHLYAVGLLGEEGVARQLDDFRDYWMAKSGQGATKVDWARTWRTWCRKAKDWKGNGNGSGRPRPLQDDSLSASRAAGRLIEAAKRGEFSFAPRPSLYPTKSPDDLLLLPKGRDTGS